MACVDKIKCQERVRGDTVILVPSLWTIPFKESYKYFIMATHSRDRHEGNKIRRLKNNSARRQEKSRKRDKNRRRHDLLTMLARRLNQGRVEIPGRYNDRPKVNICRMGFILPL